MEAEDRFGDVLAAYLEAVDAGWAPPREQLLRRYPLFAAELREFFTNSDGVEGLTAPLRSATLLPTPGTDPGNTPTLPESAVAVLPPGRSLGDYELLEELARGGMGVVCKARQKSLNRVVALKMVLAGRFASADSLQRFRNEAEAVAQLDHANIVPVYEVGEHDGQPFFTMKFIEGGSLAAELARPGGGRVGTRRVRWAVELMATAAHAVHHAHERGILHRDLKPGNILLDRDGRPHVTDFGLAKRLVGDAGLTQSNAVLGTPNYMPPEQALAGKKPLTTAADVYALGAILYELLTDAPPFQGGSPMETLQRVLHEQPPAPRSLNPHVDRDLERVCLKCLEKDAGRRYATAEELAADLERWLRGEAVSARPAGPIGRLYHWSRRRPTVAALLAASVVVTLGFGGLAGFSYFRARLHAEREMAEANASQAVAHAADAEQARREVRRSLYVADLTLAQRAWEDGRVEQALALLDQQEPNSPRDDLRGFEWHFLRHQCEPPKPAATVAAEADVGKDAARSPDGTRVASPGPDRTIRLRDARTGRTLLTLRGPTADVGPVAYSPDGSRVAAADASRRVWVWDAANGKTVASFEAGPRPVTAVATSPDGRLVAAAGDDRTVHVWDASTGEARLTIPAGDPAAAMTSFSPEARPLAPAPLNQPAPLRHSAVRGVLQPGVRTWAAHGKGVASLAFAPDGRLASTGGDGALRIWDVATGRPAAIWGDDADGARGAVAWGLDGRFVAGVSAEGTVKLWDLEEARQAHLLPPEVRAAALAFAPDGNRLAVAGASGAVTIWDARTRIQVVTIKSLGVPLHAVAFSPDGSLMAAGGKADTVRVWDAIRGIEKQALRAPSASVATLAFSPDGTTLVGGGERDVFAWELKSGTLRTLGGHAGPVTAVAFSPDGRRLATVSLDRTLKLWDPAVGRPLLSLPAHPAPVTAVAFSPDGKRIVTGGRDGAVKVWDAAPPTDAKK